MNIILVYIITIAAALNIVRDFANGCESQKCVDASKALSKKCEKEQENVLGCICKVNDDDYWKKLSDCIQSCDTLQDVIDTSPSGLKQLYCDAALAYASLSTLFPTNSFALSDVQVTGKGTSVIGNVLSTLSQLSLSQKSVTGDNMSESKGATRTSSIGNDTSKASLAGRTQQRQTQLERVQQRQKNQPWINQHQVKLLLQVNQLPMLLLQWAMGL